MNNQVRKVMDNETPHIVCKFGEYEIRVYWTSKKGIYGWQSMSVLFKNHSYKSYYKTSGCGYCKTSEAVEQCFRSAELKPKDYQHGGGNYGIDYKYHIGGNFHKIPVKDLRRWK